MQRSRSARHESTNSKPSTLKRSRPREKWLLQIDGILAKTGTTYPLREILRVRDRAAKHLLGQRHRMGDAGACGATQHRLDAAMEQAAQVEIPRTEKHSRRMGRAQGGSHLARQKMNRTCACSVMDSEGARSADRRRMGSTTARRRRLRYFDHARTVRSRERMKLACRPCLAPVLGHVKALSAST